MEVLKKFRAPYSLEKEMIDKIPDEFWTEERKVYIPFVEDAIFTVEVINKFMNGLKNKYSNGKERLKFIIEECIFLCDINNKKIEVCKNVLNGYKINFYIGDLLNLNSKEKWGIETFDLILCNLPPLKKDIHRVNEQYIYKLLKLSHRYLLIHTLAEWRKKKPSNSKSILYPKLIEHMSYLKIMFVNDKIDRTDYFLLDINKKDNKTIVVDEMGRKKNLDLKKYEWLPHFDFDIIFEYLEFFKKFEVCEPYEDYEMDYIPEPNPYFYKYPVILDFETGNSFQTLYSKNKNIDIRKKVLIQKNEYDGFYYFYDKKGIYKFSPDIKAFYVDNDETARELIEMINSKLQIVLRACTFTPDDFDMSLYF